MHTGQHTPLDLAKQVLMAETIEEVRRLPSFHLRGWKILDRWALHSPAKVRELEQQGEVVLLGRLLEQQNLEHKVLVDAIDLLNSGTAEHEVLAMHDIQTELL